MNVTYFDVWCFTCLLVNGWHVEQNTGPTWFLSCMNYPFWVQHIFTFSTILKFALLTTCFEDDNGDKFQLCTLSHVVNCMYSAIKTVVLSPWFHNLESLRNQNVKIKTTAVKLLHVKMYWTDHLAIAWKRDKHEMKINERCYFTCWFWFKEILG